MRTFGGKLGPYLPAMPDGEVGERRSWVNRLGFQIFNGHQDLDTIRRPKQVDGVEQLVPRDARRSPGSSRSSPAIEPVRFGNPGSRSRLLRAIAGRASYFDLARRSLREKGVLPDQTCAS